MNKAKYIRKNMNVRNKELADELNETEYYVRICKKVKTDDSLGPAKIGLDKGATEEGMRMIQEKDSIYNTSQAAMELGQAEATIHNWCNTSKLRSRKWKGYLVIRDKDLRYKQAHSKQFHESSNRFYSIADIVPEISFARTAVIKKIGENNLGKKVQGAWFLEKSEVEKLKEMENN